MTTLHRRTPRGGGRAAGPPDRLGPQVPRACPGPGCLLLAGGLALLVARCQGLISRPPAGADVEVAFTGFRAEGDDLELGYRAAILGHDASDRGPGEFTGTLQVAPVRDADGP